MIILGIETSCDETAICILETTGDKPENVKLKILSNQVLSQIALHRPFGGVFPMLAKREHNKALVPLFLKCLEEAGMGAGRDSRFKIQDSGNRNLETNIHNTETLTDQEMTHEIYSSVLQNTEIDKNREPEMWRDFFEKIPALEKPPIDLISVTAGPGLEPALWTGINFAKALAEFWQIPLLPVNHMEGHIFASLLNPKIENEDTKYYTLHAIHYPALALLVSGGHTELILTNKMFDYKLIGATRDDAVGEAFDKVARVLGLPYPGGPEISKLAKEWRQSKKTGTGIKLPRPMINSPDFDFSFSGLKTSVLYLVKKLPEITADIRAEICCEFENAIIETLITKVRRAVNEYGAETLIVGGGVASNNLLRVSLINLADELKIDLHISEISHSTDNALMIATAGVMRHISGNLAGDSNFRANGTLSLDA